jgi:hypothetical protein
MLKSNISKIIECLLLTFITITAFYWAPQLTKTNCVEITPDIAAQEDIAKNLRAYDCPDGYYNPFASLVFN